MKNKDSKQREKPQNLVSMRGRRSEKGEKKNLSVTEKTRTYGRELSRKNRLYKKKGLTGVRTKESLLEWESKGGSGSPQKEKSMQPTEVSWEEIDDSGGI